jgi:hypothetical protein
MGKPLDENVPILPSTTRRGTTLNTSIALSPSVMSKLLTPPHAHATHTSTSAELKMLLIILMILLLWLMKVVH